MILYIKSNKYTFPLTCFYLPWTQIALYTNIDIAEGLQAVKNVFCKYTDITRPDKELLQLLDINLTRNDFEFNGEFFLQTKGTAMGKRFAPAYANIFMAEWEMTALASCSKKTLHYYRYLDTSEGYGLTRERILITF